MNLILVIEDNIALRENTVELLELAGFKVLTADNGMRGYELALKHFPDVILCDMVMPQSGGNDFLKLLKDNPAIKNIPLIFFSAGSAPIPVSKGLIAGADAYLKKPFSNDDLQEVVRECLKIGEIRKSKVS